MSFLTTLIIFLISVIIFFIGRSVRPWHARRVAYGNLWLIVLFLYIVIRIIINIWNYGLIGAFSNLQNTIYTFISLLFVLIGLPLVFVWLNKNVKTKSTDDKLFQTNSKLPLNESETKCNSDLKYNSQSIKANCPKCGKPLLNRNGRFGHFLGCAGYPNCKYTRNIS